MPAMASVPKVVKVTITQNVTGLSDPIANSFHVQYSGTAPTPTDLGTFANAIFEAWGTNMAAVQDTGTEIALVTCTDLSSPTAAVGVSTEDVIAGSRTGTAVPADLAVVAKQAIARRYRGGHPKNFLRVGVLADLNDIKSWTSGFVTSVQSAWGTFMDTVLAAIWTGAGVLLEVAVSYFLGYTNFTEISGRVRAVPTPRTGGPLVDAVVGTIIDSALGSQRRRLQR